MVAAEAIEIGQGATHAFSMIEQVLRQAGIEREEIECLAVGIGPGSYTGIRAAIAIAQGWQLARNVKLLGISSADCIAAQAQADGLTGSTRVVIDAQRNDLYVALYELEASSWRSTAPLRLATVAEVQSSAHAQEHTLGPEATCWLPDGRNIFPRAITLARLGLHRNDYLPGNQIEPIYLREAADGKRLTWAIAGRSLEYCLRS
jgi:tRNA threonylcarbamoyl adenosine modification protein YeaZ